MESRLGISRCDRSEAKGRPSLIVRTAPRSRSVRAQLVMVVIPILLSLPAMFFSVPPLMVRLPTALAFGVQIATPVFGLTTTLTVVRDGFIQVCLCLFDGMLTL